MDKYSAINAVLLDNKVECNRVEYFETIRPAIQLQADIWASESKYQLSKRALAEVLRLDRMFANNVSRVSNEFEII